MHTSNDRFSGRVSSRLMFWSFFLLLWVISCWPFWAYPSPGLVDYHNHLARLHILTGHLPEGWSAFYMVRHEWVPNLALDILAKCFVDVGLSPETSLRVFAAMAFFSIPVGVLALSRSVNEDFPWMVLWAFPLAFNLYFIYGFLNYIFSIGLALLVMALWVSTRPLKGQLALLLAHACIAALLAVLLVSHLMGYGLAAAAISLYELGRIYPSGLPRKALAGRVALLMLTVLPSAIFYLVGFDHSKPPEIQYFNILRAKLVGVFSPFLAYYGPAAMAAVAAFAVGLCVGLGKLAFAPRTWPASSFLPVAGMFLLFLVAPSAMMGSYSLDRRLFICVVLLFLGLAVVRLPSRQALAMGLVAVLLQLGKVVEVSTVWATQSRVMSQVEAAVQQIPVGAKVGGASFTDTGSFEIPPLRHALMVALIERSAFVPNLFAQPFNGESVAYRREYQVRHQALLSALRPDDPVPWDFVCSNYEYFLLTYMSRFPKTPACLHLLGEGEGFNLYSVIKP